MLLRKMLRDMKLHKTQFISIFLMSVLGVFIYAGITGEWYGLKCTVDNYYNETNLADAWVYKKGFTVKDADAVSGINGVTGVERRLSFECTAALPNNPTLNVNFVEENKISKCHLVEGEEFSLDKDGIWLDYQFAEASGLKIGDSVELSAEGLTVKKKILGTVMNPEYIYAPGTADIIPNHANYGFAFLPAKAFPAEILYTELLIKTNRTVNTDFEDDISDALGGKYSVFQSRNSKASYMQFNSEISEHKSMGTIFPIAFLAVAMLTILTTMVRLVNSQRTQIGILKAVGFKKRRILFHYVSYGLWISLAGSIIGVILGPVTIPYLFYGPMQTTFTLPEWKPAMSASVIWMALIAVAGCTLTTYLACVSNLKDTPAQSLRPKTPKNIKHSAFDRMHLWKKLGFNSQWNLRDAFRSKVRSIMAIAGVLGCMALLVCALGMKDSLDDVMDWNFNELNLYKTKITLSQDASTDKVNALLKKYNGEALMEGAIEIKANGIKKSGELLVTDHTTLMKYEDKFRNPIELPKEGVFLSYKMANNLKVAEGDEISWHIYGEEGWKTSKIAAIYRTPISQGITMPKESFEKLGLTFLPTSVITGTDNVNEADNKAVTKVWTKKDLNESYEIMTEAMSVLIYILIAAAVVLAAVVLYNLGVLSFTERQRELSTLKVIGFKTKKIRTLLLTQNIWMTAIGIILGIPAGIWMLNYIFRTIGDTFDFVVVVKFYSYILCILGTFLVSILVNRLFSRRVKNLDMVSSLKGVE